MMRSSVTTIFLLIQVLVLECITAVIMKLLITKLILMFVDIVMEFIIADRIVQEFWYMNKAIIICFTRTRLHIVEMDFFYGLAKPPWTMVRVAVMTI